MKLLDTVRLALRNLINNASHFVLSLMSIILLSVLVMTLANFCWTLSENIKKNDINTLNENGVYISIAVRHNSPNSLTLTDQYAFADFVEEQGLLGSFESNSADPKYKIYYGNGSYDYLEIQPYFGRFSSDRELELIKGEGWTKADEGKPHIWLSQEIANKLGVSSIDDKLIFANGISESGNIEFTVKGIITGNTNYVDIGYFDIKAMSITSKSLQIKKYGEISALRKNVHSFMKSLNVGAGNITDTKINGNFMDSPADEIAGFVYGICAALIAVSIGVCLVSVLHTLETNIENNNNSLGLMKALGTRNRDMKAYIFTQIMILIVIATVIAMLISCLISYVALTTPMQVLMEMIFTDTVAVSASTGFWFVLPILNIVFLGGVVGLSSIPMLRRYMKLDAIKIINEGNI